ncbi:SDR family mycofactocin-dependent oxidoreductase [Rhodococcus sp. ACS1]|uniref:mycofactocin-coupled SDR family oxidoreductase n=1 Tax=Rhodococcus sp. ACS1 TaxID=2028570 RepID=UPI000BB0E408|nr:mycofactocin-coupled SDR family oxidoreductase [Rhodococcus sp. ACS1]PBC35540.1 SDR family mycofactocin-dependent oxidoreductase [Rhodococcus sp. ACS1]
MGRVEGKVAFITGAARGQGRSHAVRLAEEGADIVAVDICGQIDSVPFPMATPSDLQETAELVEKQGRRVVAIECDVRDYEALNEAACRGATELGKIDIVAANAGISSTGKLHELPEQKWQDVIDVNLTGVWHTCKATVPHLISAGGGSIVVTSSMASLRTWQNIGHYAAAKHGVVGVARVMAAELAPFGIRVNALHPTQVDTPMLDNDWAFQLFRPDLERPSKYDVVEPMTALNLQPVPWVDPIDVSNALLFLASDEARHITGVSLPVDAGANVK